jgi:hypothetical protein
LINFCIFTVSKILACVVIATLVMECVQAAPLSETQQKNKQNTKNPKNHRNNKGGTVQKRNFQGFKHFNSSLLTEKDYQAWTNPCNAAFLMDPSTARTEPIDREKSFENVSVELCVNCNIGC